MYILQQFLLASYMTGKIQTSKRDDDIYGFTTKSVSAFEHVNYCCSKVTLQSPVPIFSIYKRFI